jgi:hypothetical protein
MHQNLRHVSSSEFLVDDSLTITIAEVYYGLMKSLNTTKLLKLFESAIFPRATILPFAFSAAKKMRRSEAFWKKRDTSGTC